MHISGPSSVNNWATELTAEEGSVAQSHAATSIEPDTNPQTNADAGWKPGDELPAHFGKRFDIRTQLTFSYFGDGYPINFDNEQTDSHNITSGEETPAGNFHNAHETNSTQGTSS